MLKRIVIFITSLFLLNTQSLFAYASKTDSLLKHLENVSDTARINTLNRLCVEYFLHDQYEKGAYYAQEALKLSTKIDFVEGEVRSLLNIALNHYLKSEYEQAIKVNKQALDVLNSNTHLSLPKLKADALKNMADVYLFIEEYDKAIDYYSSAYQIGSKIPNINGFDDLCENFANAYYFTGAYQKAIEYYLYALKEKEKRGKQKELPALYNNIGSVYLNQNDYKNALKYFLESTAIAQQVNIRQDYARALNNIGNVYKAQDQKEKALEYYLKALDLKEKLNDKSDEAMTLMNIGGILSDMDRYDDALKYLVNALEIFEKEGSKKGMAISYANIGALYGEKKNSIKADEYYQKGIKIAQEIKDNELQKNIYENLSGENAKIGNYKSAYEYHRRYTAIKDTLLNEQNSKAMLELQTKYQTEKQQLAIDNLNKENDLKDEKIKKEKLIRYVFVAGFMMVLALTFIVYRSYREKRKANIALEEKNNSIHQQKTIIELQKSEVEQKNKEITDSINYALRIQNAIIPSDKYMYNLFPESFVFYAPKDIVSGDFYWMSEKNDWQLLAAVDCTGHGVPGALMSMIGHNLLNQIVNERAITDPGEILNNLNVGVRHALKQDTDESNSRDGMDIALCAVNRKTKELKYAGANRPLYLFQNGKLNEFKPDKFPIGGIQEEEARNYTSHTVKYTQGDVVYVFSDGYVDQFGGQSGKKFMAKQLKEMLNSIHIEPMKQQKNILQNSLVSWKGAEEQVDDILLMGLRL